MIYGTFILYIKTNKWINDELLNEYNKLLIH